jgi:hypothetical protein
MPGLTDLGALADSDKLSSLDDDRSIPNHATLRVDSDQPIDITDQKVGLLPCTHRLFLVLSNCFDQILLVVVDVVQFVTTLELDLL